jgi:hypothetical protein
MAACEGTCHRQASQRDGPGFERPLSGDFRPIKPLGLSCA